MLDNINWIKFLVEHHNLTFCTRHMLIRKDNFRLILLQKNISKNTNIIVLASRQDTRGKKYKYIIEKAWF